MSGAAAAQYLPNSGQAFQVAPAFNPAFAGTESYGDLKLGYRYQWTGFKDGPKFINLQYNFRLKQPLDLTTHAVRSSLNSNKKSDVPMRKRQIHALGLSAFNEQVGLIKRLGGGLTYAWHIPLSKKVYWSTAISAIAENTRLSVEDVYLGKNPDSDPFYDNLLRGSTRHTDVTVRAGFLVYGQRFYIGGAYIPVWQKTFEQSDVNFTANYYLASAQAGYSFDLNRELTVKTSVWGLMQRDNQLLIDYSAKLYLEQKAWFGATYRDIKSGVISAGLNVNTMFSFGYAYEFSMGRVKEFNGGSHELMLALKVNNFKRKPMWTW